MSQPFDNMHYIDELYRQYLADPGSVSEAWQEFFQDFRPQHAGASAPAATPPAAPAPGDPNALSKAGATASASAPAAPSAPTAAAPPAAAAAAPAGPPEGGQRLRGIAQKIVENMETSLGVPTATTVRQVPMKLLEENRRVINQHQVAMAGPKISFTHLIAYAIVRALRTHPRMNVIFNEHDGAPYAVPKQGIHLGLAIDMEKRGERVLVVPNVKDAQLMNFPEFVAAYNDLIVRARDNRLQLDDYQGTTISITNPGMIGTAMSVPRLMDGQAAIIGVGSIGYPAEYSGMAKEMISELGLSKVMTLTSTYDHRVIQGAESGQFLETVGKLVQGHHDFFKEIFAELKVPQEPMEWSGDLNPHILGGSGNSEAIAKQAGVLSLIRAYRVRGNLWADLDPLNYTPEPNPELELSTYGLTAWDLDRRFVAGNLGGKEGMRTLREILDTLQRTYCWHVGVEFMHIQDHESRHWVQENLERKEQTQPLPREEQIRILRSLNRAEAFESFLGTSYIGQKRFSLEGAETLIPMLDFLFSDALEAGIEDVVMGMAHRGRLNVLTHLAGKSYGQIFKEFEGIDPESTYGSGDVKYHLGATGTYEHEGKSLAVTLASNPSHLEAVNPVVEGMARALQDRTGDLERLQTLPVLIHGDAAFSGQGVVAETLHLSMLSGYRTGGTVHIVINNQIGFTTRPKDLRSSHYCTDVAKMVRAPIFHVNGDHPEEAVKVIRHALAYRQAFQRDVVVDLVCYRRWGHNEGDDPSYTNPQMYTQIKEHRSVRKLYTERLLRRGDLDAETAEEALAFFKEAMREVHDEVKKAADAPDFDASPVPESSEHARPKSETGVPAERLQTVLDGLARRPDGFTPHEKLERQLARQRQRFTEDKADWAIAEALAFGTLALEGHPVRLSGEDSGRGTFSQRHAALYDQKTAEPYVPLQHLADDQADFDVFDSLLSEFAVLGFEYGYSVNHPKALVMWEAQFGDFVNGAQVIIDQFIASAEAKWGQKSSLVMLLPHGYEGQGPEHSSARLERFLGLAARRNIRVAYPSSPSQYYHLLRSQAHHPERKPLIVMTPKSLLRLPACVSPRSEFTQGSWRFVIPDETVDPTQVRRQVLCSGKIYYELVAERDKSGVDHVAIDRLEYLYPLPVDSLKESIARYSNCDDVLWVQEESRNMGAWNFIDERMQRVLPEGRSIRYCGRPRSASPATGSARRHHAEQTWIVQHALTGDAVDTEMDLTSLKATTT